MVRQVRLTFDRLLMLVLSLLVAGTTLVLALVITVHHRLNFDELLAPRIRLSAFLINQLLDNLLRDAVAQNTTTAGLLQRHTEVGIDNAELGRYWGEVLKVQRHISSLSIGREDGSYLEVSRSPGQPILVRTRTPPAHDGTSELRTYELANFPFEVSSSIRVDNLGDPRNRHWYQRARNLGASGWTEVYTFIDGANAQPQPGITYATPLKGPEGELTGVLTADFQLRSLSRYLYDKIPDSKVFLIELRTDGTKCVVTHPDEKMVGVPLGTRANPLHSSTEPIRDPMVQAFVGTLRDLPVREWTQFDELELLEFETGGTTYWGVAFLFPKGLGLNWLVCAAASKRDLVLGVTTNNLLAVAVGAVCLLLALRISRRLARTVATPVARLRSVADRISTGDFAAEPQQTSPIAEIKDLIDSTEAMKANLRSFEKYVPRDLVLKLVQSGEEAVLGGQRQELSILFADIIDFTPLAEGMAPEDLVDLLREFHTVFTTAIAEQDGTIDKFIGDAVMAFWGAPTTDDQHASHACHAALKANRQMKLLRDSLKQRDLPAIHCRIGIHTGPVVVGNLGTASRMDYTAIGDSVNLASRMEGLNRAYGTSILISADTLKSAGPEFLIRPIDRVRVKGKQREVVVYELWGVETDASPLERQLCESHRECFNLYQDQDWARAVASLEKQLEVFPEDPPALVLWERCQRFLNAPPSEWFGVHDLKSK